MTSEVEERPRLVTAAYGRHRSQWVKQEILSTAKITQTTHTVTEVLQGPVCKEGGLP